MLTNPHFKGVFMTIVPIIMLPAMLLYFIFVKLILCKLNRQLKNETAVKICIRSVDIYGNVKGTLEVPQNSEIPKIIPFDSENFEYEPIKLTTSNPIKTDENFITYNFRSKLSLSYNYKLVC